MTDKNACCRLVKMNRIEEAREVFAAVYDAPSDSETVASQIRDIQLSLVNVVTQSIPGLKSGSVSEAALEQRLKSAQKDAEGSLARQKNGGL